MLKEVAPVCHVAVEPLTALEQWKASRHRLQWVVVVNRNVGKWDAPVKSDIPSLSIDRSFSWKAHVLY